MVRGDGPAPPPSSLANAEEQTNQTVPTTLSEELPLPRLECWCIPGAPAKYLRPFSCCDKDFHILPPSLTQGYFLVLPGRHPCSPFLCVVQGRQPNSFPPPNPCGFGDEGEVQASFLASLPFTWEAWHEGNAGSALSQPPSSVRVGSLLLVGVVSTESVSSSWMQWEWEMFSLEIPAGRRHAASDTSFPMSGYGAAGNLHWWMLPAGSEGEV